MAKFLGLPDSIVFIICYYSMQLHNFQDLVSLASTCKQLRAVLRGFVAQFIFEKTRNVLIYRNTLTIRSAYNLFAPKFFLLGGMVNNRKCHLFDPTRGRFYRGIAGIGLKRTDEFDAVCYRGLVVVISGSDDSAIGKVEAYHMDSNTWHLWPGLPRQLTAISCAVIPDGNIIVSGGTDRQDSRRSGDIFILKHGQQRIELSQQGVQTFSGEWISGTYFLSKGRSHHGSVVMGNRLWIAGGLVTGRVIASNTVETVNLANGTVQEMPHMLRQRFSPKLLLVDRNLFAIGGDVEGTSLAPRRRARCAIAAYRHRIFVFGGADGAAVLSSWDFYDVRGNFWASQIQSMIREDPAALASHHVSAEDILFIQQLNLEAIPTSQPLVGLKAAIAVFLSME